MYCKKILALLVLILSVGSSSWAFANGCIVVRTGPQMSVAMDGHQKRSGDFEVTTSYRYLFSDRHFRGREEEKHRQAESTDVRNSVHSVDFTFGYRVSETLNLTVALPYINASRSSLYEHDRVNRYATTARGLGDIRLMAYREMHSTDPHIMSGFTYGIGLKLPTGEKNVKDVFYTADGPVWRHVDQSIQLGDGGTGVIAEIQAYRALSFGGTFGFLSASYLFNPEDTNGVATHRRRAAESVMSIPDSYQARLGLAKRVSEHYGLTIDGALRIEGVPAEDLIGDENGFRRPGYAVYFEPAINLQTANHRLNLSVPIAIERNRVKSVSDKANGTHGDAAFADYLVTAGYSYVW